MGISYEQFKFSVVNGDSKVAKVTLPLNSTLKSASIRIVPSEGTVNPQELAGLYNAGLYISNQLDITNERIFIPLDFGTVAYMPEEGGNLTSDELDNYIPFQTIGGFYDFQVAKSGMQLTAIVYFQSETYSQENSLDFYLYYEIEEPEPIRRRIRRRFA